MGLPATKKIILLLKIAAASVFAGRAWQHFFWDAPYRELLWDDGLMQPLIENLTPWTWHEYVTNLAVDEAIQRWMVGLGFFYTACAVLCFFIEKIPGWLRWLLWVGVGGLVVLALLYMKEYFFHAGQFFEYTLQFGAPVVLLLAWRKSEVPARLVFWMKIAIALTFACHGLYSVGYYPRPANFTEMTMNILGFSQQAAVRFLNIAGMLDFAVAVGIFLPGKWAKWVLVYATVWGLATSLARIFGNFYWSFPLDSLHQWVFQAAYRLPHGLVPWAVLVWMNQKNITSPESPPSEAGQG
ncbi:MAG: hypothetical protein HY842_06480 [Bacteroidetes bacterium]|nr:hypothetical protein [Bacteroidota bacterium]